MAVIHQQVALSLADVALLEALERQQPQKLTARHVHMRMRRGDKRLGKAVLIEPGPW